MVAEETFKEYIKKKKKDSIRRLDYFWRKGRGAIMEDERGFIRGFKRSILEIKC